MRKDSIAVILAATVAVANAHAAETKQASAVTPADADRQMKLWKQINIRSFKGTFPCPGDLDNDGRVDFVLYRQGPQTTPGYMAAVDHDGKKLWEMGAASIRKHSPDGKYGEPALRGIALVYDVDRDGEAEVITEFWTGGKPMLYVLDGATGTIEHAIPSPFDPEVRGGQRSRCHPMAQIAYLEGTGGRPAIVLKYEASGRVPCHAVALDPTLKTLWHLETHGDAMGHIPTVGDVDGDGGEEIALGRILVDAKGQILWEKQAQRHADCTAMFDLSGKAEKRVLVSICGTGPAFCLSADGRTVWEKTTREVSHGQGIWAGNFIAENAGPEVIILRSGHVGDFLTVRAEDGAQLAAFKHRRQYGGYPDFPCVVNWKSREVQSLWIPIDRCLVDGQGAIVAELGGHEERVRSALQWGTTKAHVATQAFALDLCGDARDELVLYQPYNGEAILIFTQPDSDGSAKPYVHHRNAYNMHSYF